MGGLLEFYLLTEPGTEFFIPWYEFVILSNMYEIDRKWSARYIILLWAARENNQMFKSFKYASVCFFSAKFQVVSWMLSLFDAAW